MNITTLVDLADYLKLDKSTVSRALSGKPGVSVRTRERVVRVAREVGYVPNIHGQRLRNGHSKTLGLLVYELQVFATRFHGPLTLEIISAVASRGYDLSVVDAAQYPQEDIAHVLFQKGVAGVVIMGGSYPAEALGALWKSALPAIQLDVHSDDFPDLPFVASNNFDGVYRVTRYLIALGHRRLACLGDPDRLSCYRERYRGFQQALAEAGLEEIGRSPVPDERHAAELLRAMPRPTAIVALSDTYAEGAVAAARACDLAIPRDLSVTGFDDIDKSLVASLSLTTVRADLGGLARAAIDFLVSPGTTGSSRAEIEVETELIFRGSSGPAPPATR